ncbi:MAG: hypothetical protein JYX80_06455 [Candidatus Scalindua sediminis]|nr:hypothetical protein [Candidatus Scalindua sediminis]
MKKRIIYSYFNVDEHRLIVDSLHDKHCWEPIFFHGDESMRSWVEEKYPDAVLQDAMALRQSRFDYSRIGKPVPIDAEIIGTLSRYESRYLNWLEDTTGWNFSFYERRRYYYDLLKYWNTVIHHLKPDIFVAYTWPHLPSDYPLYILCKHYYSIPVVFFIPIPFLEDEYYTFGYSLEDLSAQFSDIYLSEEYLEVSNVVKKYLARLRSQEAKSPKYVIDYYRRLDKSYRYRHMDILRLLKMILRGTAFNMAGIAFKKNKKPWESKYSKLTNIGYLWFKSNLVRKNKKLKRYYNKLAKPADLKEKYLYFPAPYQPEAISNLFVGVYEDIFLVLDMITDIIPGDWVIYYKEHPNTLKERDKGALGRSNHFYNKVNSYSNVRIIPFETNTFTLIDNSQAVFTVGGTAGWEAIVRGKPALFFGSLWYQSCKSVFFIRTYDDAKEAIENIVNGFVPDEGDVERFAEAMHKACIKDLIAVNDIDEKTKKCNYPKHEMERIAKAFYKAYEMFYGR